MILFQSTPSARRATRNTVSCWMPVTFQSTPSARRATKHKKHHRFTKMNFNPRPPRGGRPALKAAMPAAQKFQSTPSARRATKQPVFSNNRRIISIHALREEGDGILYSPNEARLHISIHALREEGDPNFCLISSGSWSFQSTPSARRATSSPRRVTDSRADFNPRPPRGGRRIAGVVPVNAELFQSTPSARRATRGQHLRRPGPFISIHALREEGDLLFNCWLEEPYKFQSTPSARRATEKTTPAILSTRFQSTPSARRATVIVGYYAFR